MGNVFTAEDLKNLQALPFEQKLEATKSFIKHLLFEHARPIIAWSGGRDSTVLLYLALQEKPDVDVMWVNTGIEFPECVKFIRYLARKWGYKSPHRKAKPNVLGGFRKIWLANFRKRWKWLLVE